ncbi:MAG: WS/DGAT domain-containing protein [Gemmatimonadales bacterium]
MVRLAREPVAANDAVWLQDSATNRMVIHALYTTDQIDLETARAIFRERVIDADGGRRYHRFHQRLVRARGRWYWEDDPDFDLARHLVASPLEGCVSATQLQDYISSIAHEPLAEGRPPWTIEHIEHYEGGQSAFLVRVHHSMADGIAFVPIIFALMDELAPSVHRTEVAPGIVGGLGRAVLASLVSPIVLMERALWRPDRHALHGPPVGGRKRVAWTRPLPLQEVKRLKTRFGATVNDVLMALVSGAIGTYLESNGGTRRPHVRISMPVNMREPGAALRMENRFAAVPLTLPIAPRELGLRIAAVKARMDELKNGLDSTVIYGAVNVFLTALPFFASRRLIDFFANKCTSVVTNVMGPQVPLALGGKRLRSLVFWVPQRADIGVGISVMTFAGNAQVGVIADTRVLADPGVLVRAIEAEFDALSALT